MRSGALLDREQFAARLCESLALRTPIPLLALRWPQFAQMAWREGKPAARRFERLTAAAFRSAAKRILRDGDAIAHDPGSDWFVVAMLEPGRDGVSISSVDARAALERIACAMAQSGECAIETGWWPVANAFEGSDVVRTITNALERGLRERERYEFLATVGHELRTPLTSIRGYLETLIEHEVDPVTRRRFLETARHEALRLGRLVEGMLEFSLLDLSPSTSAQACIDLVPHIRATLDALLPQAVQRRIALHCDVPTQATARVDADAFQHALVNVIENAVKFGREGGVVVVACRLLPDAVEIAVDDDGPGIAAEERAAVFGRHFRGASAHGAGSGIGLAIVKSIVERASGAVQLGESRLGGARFAFRFPRHRAESAGALS